MNEWWVHFITELNKLSQVTRQYMRPPGAPLPRSTPYRMDLTWRRSKNEVLVLPDKDRQRAMIHHVALAYVDEVHANATFQRFFNRRPDRRLIYSMTTRWTRFEDGSVWVANDLYQE